MFEQMAVGDWLSNMIRMAIHSFISGKYRDLNQAIWLLMSGTLIISIIIYGFRIMFGDLLSTGKSLLKTCVIAVIAISITQPEIYQSLILDSIFKTKDNLSSFIMSGDSKTSMYEAFSNTNYRMFAHASNIIDAAGNLDFRLYAIAGSIYLIFGTYYCLFIGVTLFSELALGVLILFGVLIIPLSAFELFRGMLKNWLKSIMKYIAVFVVISFIVSMLNIISNILIENLMQEIYTDSSNSLDGDAIGLNNPTFGAVLLIGVFGSYLLFQAMEFASEITGGAMSDGKAGVTSVTNTIKSGYSSINQIKSSGGTLAKAARNKVSKL